MTLFIGFQFIVCDAQKCRKFFECSLIVRSLQVSEFWRFQKFQEIFSKNKEEQNKKRRREEKINKKEEEKKQRIRRSRREERTSALRVSRAETWLTVYRSLYIQVQGTKLGAGGRRLSVLAGVKIQCFDLIQSKSQGEHFDRVIVYSVWCLERSKIL